MADDRNLSSDFLFNEGSLFFLAPEDRGRITRHVLNEVERFFAVESKPGTRKIRG